MQNFRFVIWYLPLGLQYTRPFLNLESLLQRKTGQPLAYIALCFSHTVSRNRKAVFHNRSRRLHHLNCLNGSRESAAALSFSTNRLIVSIIICGSNNRSRGFFNSLKKRRQPQPFDWTGVYPFEIFYRSASAWSYRSVTYCPEKQEKQSRSWP